MSLPKDSCLLIVEDDLDLLDILQTYFRSQFKLVLGAASAEEALEILESQSADIIFTDIRMPGKTGIELLQIIRSKGDFTPTLIASGAADRQDLINGLKLGAYDYIDKPYELEDAKAAVYRVLEMHSRNSVIATAEVLMGDDHEDVTRQRKMVGLLQTANVDRKKK